MSNRRRSLINCYLVIGVLFVVLITESNGFLAFVSTNRSGFRDKVWCHRHADCVLLNWRWCCVPFGDRTLAINGVSRRIYFGENLRVKKLTRTHSRLVKWGLEQGTVLYDKEKLHPETEEVTLICWKLTTEGS